MAAEVLEAGVEAVDEVEEVVVQDEVFPREVEHPGGLFELAEIGEAFGEGLGDLDEVPLFVEQGLARELKRGRVLVDVTVVGLDLARETAGLVEAVEDGAAAVEVAGELGEVIHVDGLLVAVEGAFDAGEPLVELVRGRDGVDAASQEGFQLVAVVFVPSAARTPYILCRVSLRGSARPRKSLLKLQAVEAPAVAAGEGERSLRATRGSLCLSFLPQLWDIVTVRLGTASPVIACERTCVLWEGGRERGVVNAVRRVLLGGRQRRELVPVVQRQPRRRRTRTRHPVSR